MNTHNEMLKIPPQAIELEQAVLGALMLEREAIDSILTIIDTQSFYRDDHKRIFETIKTVASKKRPVDLMTVTQELKDRGLLDEVGGPLYLTQLTGKVASAANIESHARIIAEKYYLRQTILKAAEIMEMAYSGQEVETVEKEWKTAGELENIFAIADTGSHIKEVLKSTILEIETDVNRVNDHEAPGIPTGFISLDTNTGGWRGGNLIILAARPGVGKTSLALHFALEAAKAGHWVNIFSLEMNKEDLARIMIASESGVYRSDIRDGYLKPADWTKINRAIARIEKLPLIFRDAAGMTVNQIKGAIRKNRKNGKCDFVMVDYLQLVKSQQSRAVRELEVSEISRTLKTTALAEDIPILALSQLNREADGQMPRLSHLRESGAIEQDADLVCFLHKPDQDNNSIRFSIAKHRRGRLGEVEIFHNGEMTRFSEQPQDENKTLYPNERIEPVKSKELPF